MSLYSGSFIAFRGLFMTKFSSFGLSDILVDTLTSMGVTVPTPIQEQAIPFVLSGRNVLASAQTGTGKTIA